MNESEKFIVRICCEPQIKIVDDDGIASFTQKITTMRAEKIDEGIIGQLRDLMRVKGIDELYAIDESKVLEMVKKSQALEIIKKYPNNRNSLANFRYMTDYWEKNNIEVTKELLETYDFPFEVEEYDLLKEVLVCH